MDANNLNFYSALMEKTFKTNKITSQMYVPEVFSAKGKLKALGSLGNVNFTL
jgi:hypothetical protein